MHFITSMLLFFRNNRFTTIFWLALYAALLRSGAFLGWIAPPEPVQGGMFYYFLFDWLKGNPSASALISWAIVVIQGFMVNFLADRHRLSSERNWLPGAGYVLLASALPEFLFLSPPLVAATFVCASFFSLFKTYKISEAQKIIFDAGFWTGTASLFYPPAAGLLLVSFLAINSMRPFKLREMAVLVLGVLTPFWLGWITAFWFDQGWPFFDNQFYGLFGFIRIEGIQTLHDWLKLAFLFLLIVVIVLNSSLFFRKKLIHIQKRINVLYFYLLAIGIGIIFRNDPNLQYVILATPAMGIFIGLWWEGISRNWMAELFHAFLLLAIFILQYPKLFLW